MHKKGFKTHLFIFRCDVVVGGAFLFQKGRKFAFFFLFFWWGLFFYDDYEKKEQLYFMCHVVDFFLLLNNRLLYFLFLALIYFFSDLNSRNLIALFDMCFFKKGKKSSLFSRINIKLPRGTSRGAKELLCRAVDATKHTYIWLRVYLCISSFAFLFLFFFLLLLLFIFTRQKNRWCFQDICMPCWWFLNMIKEREKIVS